MSMYSNMTYENDTRKIDKALKKYEEKKNAALVLLAEIDMLNKMEDVEDTILWKQKSMKEKLIAAERQRRDVEEMLINYIGKYDDHDLHRYTELLEELKKDKPK